MIRPGGSQALEGRVHLLTRFEDKAEGNTLAKGATIKG